MPYINKHSRIRWGLGIEESPLPIEVGSLNYQITILVDEFLKQNGVNYTNLNAAIGVLECAKLELYSRVEAPYEDKKMKENGDVYDCNI